MADPQNPQQFPPPSLEDRAPQQESQASPPPVLQPAGQYPPKAPAQQPSGFRKGFGAGLGVALGAGLVLAIAGTLITALFLVFGMAALADAGKGASTGLTTIWGQGSKTLRAIRVEGMIMSDSGSGSVLTGGTYGYEIAQQFDDLSAEDASGVVLLINTPGGSIAGSRAIADAIDRYQERTGHKVFVHISESSTSGGVYATATADEIVADHGSLIGSIGVLMRPFPQYNGVIATSSTLFEQGVTTTGGITHESLTAGKGKDQGSPWRALTDEERQALQSMLDSSYQDFVNFVAQHRGIAPEVIINEMGAHIFANDRAQNYGLIDATMGRDEFFRHAAQQAGLDPNETRVEAIAQPTGLTALLGVHRAFGHAPAVVQSPGSMPVLNQAICGRGEVVAFAGDLTAACGS